MKLNQTIMLASLVVGGLFAGPLQAQDTPKDKPAGDQPPAVAPVTPRRPQFSLEGMAKALDLTEDQKTKVKPIMDDQVKKSAEVRNDKALSPEDRRAKMKEIRDATGAQLKPILTAEQYAKWEKLGPQNRRPMMTPPGAPAAPAAPATEDKPKN